jgi:predicted NAD-dependent protein-ADP-ribosyltransferase YbiA (DUF1768 family)
MTIAFAKSTLPFGWMGNMTGGFPIIYKNQQWGTSEALFQSMRFEDPIIKEEIRNAKGGFEAKIVAKKYSDKMIVVPTSKEDLNNMEIVLTLKVEQNPSLRKRLLSTGDELIIENVTSRGLSGRNGFWGASNKTGEWVGENNLGKLWMKIRSKLQEKITDKSVIKEQNEKT